MYVFFDVTKIQLDVKICFKLSDEDHPIHSIFGDIRMSVKGLHNNYSSFEFGQISVEKVLSLP